MSNTTRNRNYRQKPRKNTNNSSNSDTADTNPKNKGFKARKTRNMRPDRSKGMKSHGDIRQPRPNTSKNIESKGSNTWIWGVHAGQAALNNPKRTLHKILMSPRCAERLNIDPLRPVRGTPIEITPPAELDALLPDGAAHQGIALACAPLPAQSLHDIADEAKGLLIVLDQITDPHNVGAIFRLAKAFGAKAVIMQSRNAPPLTGATAKVAVGTIETVPHVHVTNIANTLLELQKMNWRVTGLAGEANITLKQAFQNADAEVLVLGAEGPGLRKRVRDCCDQLAKIPMPGGAESLNVSTAAAIALYEAVRPQ